MNKGGDAMRSRILGGVLFFVAILAFAPFNGCGHANGAETPGSPEVTHNKLATLDGARPDCKYYKETLLQLGTRAAVFTANDYARLWETAYAYRDRIGAKKISVAIAGSGSRFWCQCFLTLAEGQELAPPTLANFRPADLSKGNQMVFELLFPYRDLQKSGVPTLKMIASLIKECYKVGPTEIEAGTLTVEDAYQAMSREVSAATLRGDYISVDKVRQFNALNRLAAAVLIAFKSCHYESGDKWLKVWLAANSGTVGSVVGNYNRNAVILPMLYYYSGESICLQMGQHELKGQLVMATCSGIKLAVVGSREALSEESNLVLGLSRERERLPWIRKKSGGSHLVF